ncbi:hypothetical protein BOTBODRAFT_107008 [Botryobasidium botryosum FD-172 SS1]|uniref:NADPH-dependent diflavin oxidoreductase 1 n=1 Tax=Botryobasidium botryosum (strain FD-172 SS1) TaxID=930990 RepID=A0A067MX43_BOTB1|nr:hypothetical protein BOTBODRAFT_107008 [Botryobasidium botryosum FD-172 SS1]
MDSLSLSGLRISDNHEDLPERSLLVLYGSETGTAQDAAERIGREALRYHFRTRVVAMDEYSIHTLVDETLVVFVCATTGNGVEPRNMTALWRALLRSDLPEDLFDHMYFAVFGLGDSGYDRFCWAGKKLHRRLLALGGKEIVERADADDQHYMGIDGTLDPWINQLFSALGELYPLPPGLHVLPPAAVCPPRASFLPTSANLDAELPHLTPSGTTPFRVERIDRITRADWFQDVRHVELSCSDDILYEPGDVAVLYPSNAPEDVEAFLKRMKWRSISDKMYQIQSIDSDRPLPSSIPRITTLRKLFSDHLDISAVPRRSFFEFLFKFAKDEHEKEKLEEFCSPEGQEDLYDYCNRPRRTILEVILEFRSVDIPLDYVVDVFPLIRPRQFSIASSIKANPKKIQLCIAVVRYRSKLKAPRKGLCTSWLTRLNAGDTISVGIEKGTMRLPGDSSVPVILVGPGTGVAPMRAFIQDRIHRGARANLLYFGCRSLEADCHYKDDWDAHIEKGELTCRIAASRDQVRITASKVYVQDLIREDSKTIWEWIVHKGAHFYISGSASKMPTAVRLAVEFVLRKEGGWSEDEAGMYVKNMETAGRWAEECWT